MNLQAHYDAMRAAAYAKLAQGAADLDPLLDSPHDDRRGLTLLARPPAPILEIITDILADFQRDEPAQYYYPAPDIHLTILSIISCYSGFTLAAINPADYQAALHTILEHTRPFTLKFAGLTASPGGVLVQGFPLDDGLQELRDQVRTFFRGSGLPQTIDQRYPIQTAHATVLRFRHTLGKPGALLQKLAAYEHYFIGTFEVNNVALVYNDWYQRQAHTVVLGDYPLVAAQQLP